MGRPSTPKRGYSLPDYAAQADIPADLNTLATPVDGDIDALYRRTDQTPWLSYTPTWRNGPSPGTILSVGSGTLEGRYQIIRGTVHANIHLVRAADSNVGNTTWFFGLPVAARAWTDLCGGVGWLFQASGTQVPLHLASIGSRAEVYTAIAAGGNTNANRIGSSTASWASGDRIILKLTYEAA